LHQQVAAPATPSTQFYFFLLFRGAMGMLMVVALII
jgi:hypothetical protein